MRARLTHHSCWGRTAKAQTQASTLQVMSRPFLRSGQSRPARSAEDPGEESFVLCAVRVATDTRQRTLRNRTAYANSDVRGVPIFPGNDHRTVNLVRTRYGPSQMSKKSISFVTHSCVPPPQIYNAKPIADVPFHMTRVGSAHGEIFAGRELEPPATLVRYTRVLAPSSGKSYELVPMPDQPFETARVPALMNFWP